MEYSRSLRERYRSVVQQTHKVLLELVTIVEERRMAEILGMPEPADLYVRCDALKARIRAAQKEAHALRAEIATEQISAGKPANSSALEGLEVPDFLPEEI